MGQISTPKDITHLPLLKYTGLFGLGTIITETDTEWIIEYDDKNGSEVCEAIENHNSYNMDFPPEVQQEMIVNAGINMTKTIDEYLDGIAKEQRYDDMKSVRSYTGFENPFKEECIKIATWGADCWIVASGIETDVIAGNRPLPTSEEVISELPILIQ